ncbi:MAG: EAL domain-containing protein (putative c-di-GMP-specific phosphodiesterase class I) [Oleiphilaceae bacterium]|jgi:EAL domain-containing protein (putative c-di-GMP-specific phosphodiesterase class I)/GGDEF domain-containing protein
MKKINELTKEDKGLIMERRSSLRKPIHHDAMLKLDNGGVWPCIIADYCAGGLLLKYTPEVCEALAIYTKAVEGRTLKVAFYGQQHKEYELESTPAHVMEQASGLRFIGRYNDAIASLTEFNAQRQHNAVPQGKVKQIIRECTDCIQDYTQPLMEDFYPAVIKDVKAAAVGASSDQLSNSIMEAANKITREQASMLKNFMVSIQDPKSVENKETDFKKDALDDLSLIDKEAFEDWLISRVLITKAETNYRALLLPLKIRLDAIGVGDKRYHQSPLGPSLLVGAFQSSLARLAIGGVVERLVFRNFEQQVITHLEPLYTTLNDILIRHKILPDLDISKIFPRETNTPRDEKNSSKKSDVKHKQAASTAESDADVNITDSNSGQLSQRDEPVFSYGAEPAFNQSRVSESFQSAESQSIVSALPPFSSMQGSEKGFKQNHDMAEKAFENVLGLVRSLRISQNASNAELGITPPAETYSESELKQGLSELQASSAESEVLPEDRSSLLERVQLSIVSSSPQNDRQEKGIDEGQQVAIDVVDRFFASMQKNPRLSQEAKQHLLKLEVPVLKVLLKDEYFFDDRNSSVRAVMNRIAQLGATGVRMSPSNRKKVDGLVNKVVQEFEHDIAVFDHVLKEMDALVEHQNKLYMKNVARVAAAAEGVYKVEQAKIEVSKALNECLKQRDVPPAVVTLIDNGWQDLLQLIYIKQGEGSEEWIEALAVLESLISFGNDPASPLDIKTILPKIQAGLKLVSGNDEPPIVIRDALKSLITTGPTGDQKCVKAKLLNVPEMDSDIVRRNTKTSKELKHWILRAKSFQPGVWVQFKRKDSRVHYMRLVWVAKGYSKFVFVNHQGMKVVELGLFKLANYLKTKQVIPDSSYELPIVNQGLDDMVKGVYDKLAYESSHDSVTGLVNKREFCRQVRAVMKTGARTSACHLLYVHLDYSKAGAIPSKLTTSVSDVLSVNKEKTSVIGRIDAGDFALFIVTDNQEQQFLCFNETLSQLCQENAELSFQLSESSAHLGFNNPELMIDHAMVSMREKLEKSAPLQILGDGERLPLVSEVEQEGEPLISDTIESIAEPSKETLSEGELDTSPSELELEIYAQKIISISDNSIYGDQYDLVCSVVGSGTSYEPEDETDIYLLDRWWIQQLMLKKEHQEPAWESIQIVHLKLSAYAFKDDSFKDWLLELVENGQLNAEHVWFDVYDSSKIENIHAAADMMRHLMVKGFHFCLDHFGTNRSPFSQLKALPVDMIKIDESFMASLNEAETDESAADSITEVAHYLGKEVIAGLVDSAICFQRMKKLGLDYIQGSTVSEYSHLDVVVAPFDQLESR